MPEPSPLPPPVQKLEQDEGEEKKEESFSNSTPADVKTEVEVETEVEPPPEPKVERTGIIKESLLVKVRKWAASVRNYGGRKRAESMFANAAKLQLERHKEALLSAAKDPTKGEYRGREETGNPHVYTCNNTEGA